MSTITKEKFLAEINKTYAELQTLLTQIDLQEMIQPTLPGGWSVKDVIAHITWHEHEMVNVVGQHALVGSELWMRSTDDRNAAIYEKYKDRPLDEILTDAEQTHAELIPLLELLTDDELNDPNHFAEMPPDWIPWDLIAGNTSRHYQDHSDDLRAWLQEGNR